MSAQKEKKNSKILKILQDKIPFALRNFERHYVKDEKTGCWNWDKLETPSGYGGFGVTIIIPETGKYKNFHKAAHRWSVVLYKKYTLEQLEGKVIDHVCKNKACVNPNHLELVTKKENIRRHFRGKKKCKNGHLYSKKTIEGYSVCLACKNLSKKNSRRNKKSGIVLSDKRIMHQRGLMLSYPSFTVSGYFFSYCGLVSLEEISQQKLKPIFTESGLEIKVATLLEWKRQFEKKFQVDEKTGCWNWNDLDKDKKGYGGQFRRTLRTENGKKEVFALMSHRWSLIFYKNYTLEQLKNKHVDHTCENKACQNPDHLKLVSVSVHCKITSKRQKYCKHGHLRTDETTGIHNGRKFCKICSYLLCKIYEGFLIFLNFFSLFVLTFFLHHFIDQLT